MEKLRDVKTIPDNYSRKKGYTELPLPLMQQCVTSMRGKRHRRIL